MSEILKGNKAVKVKAGLLSQFENEYFATPEIYTFSGILNFCESHLRQVSAANNLDVLEYKALFDFKCKKYEKLYFSALRTRMREFIHDEQIHDYSSNYDGIYHPYNPYLQKYNGAYLRNYQSFD